MSHEERLELINKPFPTVKIIKSSYAYHGSCTGYSEYWVPSRRGGVGSGSFLNIIRSCYDIRNEHTVQ